MLFCINVPDFRMTLEKNYKTMFSECDHCSGCTFAKQISLCLLYICKVFSLPIIHLQSFFFSAYAYYTFEKGPSAQFYKLYVTFAGNFNGVVSLFAGFGSFCSDWEQVAANKVLLIEKKNSGTTKGAKSL